MKRTIHEPADRTLWMAYHVEVCSFESSRSDHIIDDLGSAGHTERCYLVYDALLLEQPHVMVIYITGLSLGQQQGRLRPAPFGNGSTVQHRFMQQRRDTKHPGYRLDCS